MFYSITGKVLKAERGYAVVECGGVGFLVNTTMETVCALNGERGQQVTLFTHMSVREDAIDLFGFRDEQELAFFRLLITVTGVGPKAALAVLSAMPADKLALCIVSGDTKSITKAQGIGTKIAQRIVLELKDKLKKEMPALSSGIPSQQLDAVASSSSASEAVEALVSLGYAQSEAAKAVASLDSTLSSEELIRRALKLLAINF